MREKMLKTTSDLTGPSKPPLAQSVQNRMASTNGAWTPAFERFTSVCDGLWALHVWGGLRATHAPVVQPSAASATHPFGTGFGRPRPTPVRCGLRPLLTRVRRPSAAASSQLWCGHGRLSHTSMCKLDSKRNVPELKGLSSYRALRQFKSRWHCYRACKRGIPIRGSLRACCI